MDGPAFREDAVSSLGHNAADDRYDQAQLASCALDFALLSEKAGDKKICLDLAADILEYSMRDLLGKEGAFFSAEDADSAPRPGATKSGG